MTAADSADQQAAIERWFLTSQERGNPFTRLDYRRGGQAWSSGNRASGSCTGWTCESRR